MFRLQHQFNNIVETTQLNNDQMPEFHCHVKVRNVHCQLQVTTPVSSCLIWEIFRSLVDRSLWQVAPKNLKCFLEFSACFRLCFKLAVSLQHCTPYVIVHWVYIRWIWKPLVFCDDIWTAGLQPVLHAAHCACWCVVLLEDESGGQPAIASKER